MIKHMPTLMGKEAKAFINQDKKPLTEKQKGHLLECLKIYKNSIVGVK